VPVVVLTGYGSIELAVRAIKEGAEQFLTKPVDTQALLVLLDRLVEGQRLRRKQVAERPRPGRESIDPFLGQSAAITTLREEARRLLDAERPVLIQGETGTGKGVLARWLHEHGPRRQAAFVDLNCAGLSRELLDSEMFGHEAGAFTGALKSKPGLLEVAHRGTLFLDEIGDLDLAVQPKLLKVLEEQRFRRLGDVRDRGVDVRLIAATHQDLARLMAANRFREDLFFRISTLPLVLPPLRERREDIAPLARHFLDQCAAELGCGPVALADEALAELRAYAWPGNIRELRNVIERALLVGGRSVVASGQLQFGVSPPPGGARDEPVASLEEVERAHIARVFELEERRVDRAALRLGISTSSLYERLKRFGIPTRRNPPEDEAPSRK
jgi:DNA-binding NtrC family response regulator